MIPQKKPEAQKKPLPPPGRRANLRNAIARTNQKFGKALAQLAK